MFEVFWNMVADALPDLPPETLFPQLAEIQGVLFLKSGQPGLRLSSDPRREIGDALTKSS